VTSLALRRSEILNANIRRPHISHVVFDFDGTLSWLRHGWPHIMLQVVLAHFTGEWSSDGSIQAQLHSDILSLNGKPSIHQLECCWERARFLGQTTPTAPALLDEYLQTLRGIVKQRVASIRAGICCPNAFIVWNARAVLETLQKRGLTLIILSGTVERDVRAEAELLGLSCFFGNHIYGAPLEGVFSKKVVIDRIMREERIEGQNLLAFGDGPVEIECTKAIGGMAIGVASDEEENGSHQIDAAKRQHLVRAGADVIIPDYTDADALLAMILEK
jgi:phosphoglycolate phosphatase